MAAAAHAGVHGLDPWLESLRALIDAEPVPATLEDALAPLAALGGADVAAALRAVERQRRAPPGAWHPDDWRRTHPDFPEDYAFAIFVYTLQDPNVYQPLGGALHPARGRPEQIGDKTVKIERAKIVPPKNGQSVGVDALKLVAQCFIKHLLLLW